MQWVVAVDVLNLLAADGPCMQLVQTRAFQLSHDGCLTQCVLPAQEQDRAVQRVVAVDVLNLLAADGPYAQLVRDLLDASEVWQAYKDRKHDLYLPAAANAQARAGSCHLASFHAASFTACHLAASTGFAPGHWLRRPA